jgi:hypothetical protein
MARERARDHLRTGERRTPATASSGGVPEAATVQFAYDEAYDVGFNTAATDRESEHLTANPPVAVSSTNETIASRCDSLQNCLSIRVVRRCSGRSVLTVSVSARFRSRYPHLTPYERHAEMYAKYR